MPAEEAGGLSAEVDPPMESPHRPVGGIAAGAGDDGGIAAEVHAGVAPVAALLPMPSGGCVPPTGGGLSAVAKPREDSPVEVVAEDPAAKLTREAMWGSYSV